METAEPAPKFDLQPNEKFACIILNNPGFQGGGVQTQPQHLKNGCWLSEKPPFLLTQGLTQSRRDNLGKIVCNSIQQSDFVLTAKASSTKPEIYDDEDNRLNRRVNDLLWGFAITAGVPQMIEFGSYFLAGYSTTPEEIVVRQFGTLPPFIPACGSTAPHVDSKVLVDVGRFLERLEKIYLARSRDEKIYYRLMSGMGAFIDGMSERRMLAKHHQYVRAIEAFLPPKKFRGKEFCEYFEKLLKPNSCNKEILSKLYDLRSVAEHHRYFNSQKLKNAENPEVVAERLTRQAEAFAREIFKRFLCSEGDFLNHFANDQAHESLWNDNHGKKLDDAWGTDKFDIHAVA